MFTSCWQALINFIFVSFPLYIYYDSGRLVDSKANTRSAGCAAYMAVSPLSGRKAVLLLGQATYLIIFFLSFNQPERIDPKKKEYDIRADVWSLGITLVELATSTLPYKGCNNEFEVLTCILENSPPSLPTDQGFSLEFQTFVRKWLVLIQFIQFISISTK